ncbi:MAG TPA: hypothetical protein VNZ52_15045 [Candidatus Thermoplasmatota archaeon]|nr:hypothetical protein [Candidatus Thermoplasmatota archaeon]
MVLIVHADGRNDPQGACTWAFLVLTRDGARVHDAHGNVDCREGEGTSLLAEWTATVRALRWLRAERPQGPVLLRVDAALVAKALVYRDITVKGPEGLLAEEARKHMLVLRGWGIAVRVERVPRWRNLEADDLAFAAAGGEPAPLPNAGAEEAGVPPPSWREYPHRDRKGRIRKTGDSGP